MFGWCALTDERVVLSPRRRTCCRQSPFKWVLSEAFTCSACNVLMKGDGTISSKRERNRDPPSLINLIMPFINAWSLSVCVCVARALIKLFMTELIEDIKITCQLYVSRPHVRLTGAGPKPSYGGRGRSNLMWTGFTGQSERINGVPFGSLTERWGNLRRKVKRARSSLDSHPPPPPPQVF